MLFGGCYDGMMGRPISPSLDADTAAAATTLAWEEEFSSTGAIEATSGDIGASSGDEMGMDVPSVEVAARDIFITSVAANQGINVSLGHGGTPSPPQDREARIIHSRRLLVQAHVDIAPSFEPRTIIGRLSFRDGNGILQTRDHELFVYRDSDSELSDTVLHWVFDADEVQPGLAISIELFERAPEDDAATVPPRFPSTGELDLDVASSTQRLRVTIVPIRHIDGDCDRTPPTDPLTIDGYRRAAMQRLPVQEVRLTVRDPITYNGPLNEAELGPILDEVTAIRAADNPPPDVFYYGLVYSCGESALGGGLGWLPAEPASASEAQWRAAVGNHDPEPWTFMTEQTFVHEVSHNLGRKHITCAGTEANTDAAYPHPGGLIGGLGWGVEDGELRSSKVPEYMSYCSLNVRWQSDYGWNHVYPSLISLTSLSNRQMQHDGWTLLATENADGTTRSRLMPGYGPHGERSSFVLRTRDGARSLPSRVLQVGDGHEGTRVHAVWLTDAEVDALELVEGRVAGRNLRIAAPQIEGLVRARSRK